MLSSYWKLEWIWEGKSRPNLELSQLGQAFSLKP